MGKQVLAALISIGLALGAVIIPMVAALTMVMVAGFENQNDPKLVAGAISSVITLPAFLYIVTAGVSFLSLIYLKLQYGTMALLACGALLFSIIAFLNQPILAALAGSFIALLLSALVIFGLWRMLSWVYGAPVIDSEAVKEF